MQFNRRQFIGRASLVAGGALLPVWGESAQARLAFADHPFTLGVASGDPTPDGVVLWTRLAPKPLDYDGGMPAEAVQVGWEVAEDEAFRRVVRKGVEIARPQAAHSVHAEVSGLLPDRRYFYRFFVGTEQSPVGRTRTAPLAGADVQALRYAFTACQHYNANFYAPYRQMVADDPDLILFLGDYIYEGGDKGGVRPWYPKETAHDLPTYRQRYALYKTDPALQAAHAAAPWMVIWDDHEVQNNYRGDRAAHGLAAAEFLPRRAAAYQAYYEHMPLRRRSLPVGPDMLLYRSLDWGRLAQFQFADLRQYRDFTPCFAESDHFNVVDASCAERADPRRSILGATQEKWLFDTMGRSQARWNILAQQYIMAEVRRRSPETGHLTYGTDSWDGYPADRKRVLDFWKGARIGNPMALGGDIHSFIASELRETPDSPVIASAFVGGSLASPGAEAAASKAMMAENPHIRFAEGQRHGYALVDVTGDASHIAYKAAANSKDPDSTTSDLVRFVIENGKPGFTAG